MSFEFLKLSAKGLSVLVLFAVGCLGQSSLFFSGVFILYWFVNFIQLKVFFFFFFFPASLVQASSLFPLDFFPNHFYLPLSPLLTDPC